MSEPPIPTENISPSPTASPASEDDDFPSWNLTIPLEPETTTALGSTSSKHWTKPTAPYSETNDLITQAATSNLRFSARVAGAVLGTYSRAPACLVVLTFTFHAGATSSPLAIRRRIKSSEITITFFDAPRDGSDGCEDFFPVVEALYPRASVRGPVSTVDVEKTTESAVGASVALAPAGVASLCAQQTRGVARRYTEETWAEVGGMVVDVEAVRDGVGFWMREDAGRKSGVAETASVAVVVAYTPGRRFAMDVRVVADVGLTWKGLVGGKSVWGGEDAPVYFDPVQMEGRKRVVRLGEVVVVPEDEDWESVRSEKGESENVLKKYTEISFN